WETPQTYDHWRRKAALPAVNGWRDGSSSQDRTFFGEILSELIVSCMNCTASVAGASAIITVVPSGPRIEPPAEPMNSTRSQTRTSACLACQEKPRAVPA